MKRAWIAGALATVAALAWLGLRPIDLWPGLEGWQRLFQFLGHALHPALDYQAAEVPAGAPGFLIELGRRAWNTLLFAAAAMGLALAAAVPMGCVASERFWIERRRGAQPSNVERVLLSGTRAALVGLRSIHELLWAILLLAALGLTPLGAVVALALPYAGTLAKVFAETLDEEDPRASAALADLGAGPTTRLLCADLALAWAEWTSYAFYRFECCVRSAAVLGFFGYATLGEGLALSFENGHFREAWSYLYALIALALVFEFGSAKLRWGART